ncbi:hypothetical protein [Amycolatopsis sp. NPDC054798]
MTRPLNADERAVLRRVLEGNQVLLAQVDQAEVISSWSPGSVSVDLTVPDAIHVGDPPVSLPDPAAISFTE